MTKEKIQALSDKISADPALETKMKQAKNIDDIVSIMNAEGIKITKAELIRSQALKIAEFSDAELEAVSMSASYTTSTLAGCVTWVLGCCG